MADDSKDKVAPKSVQPAQPPSRKHLPAPQTRAGHVSPIDRTALRKHAPRTRSAGHAKAIDRTAPRKPAPKTR